jgi:uncharacterized protein (TIGR03435 family)
MRFKHTILFLVILVGSTTGTIFQSGVAQKVQDADRLHEDFKFEVASIRANPAFSKRSPGNATVLPDGLRSIGQNTYSILEVAFFPAGSMTGRERSLTNAPDWVTDDRYDIDARVDDQYVKEWSTQVGALPYTSYYLRAALRNLLRDRYKLRAHMVDVQVPYVSIIAPTGRSKLVSAHEVATPPDVGARKFPDGGYIVLTRDRDDNMTWELSSCSMDDLAIFITQNFGQLAQDKTGLKGKYNFKFTLNRRDWVEDPLTWMKCIDSTGLRIKNDKGPGYNLVIDHIERPSGN